MPGRVQVADADEQLPLILAAGQEIGSRAVRGPPGSFQHVGIPEGMEVKHLVRAFGVPAGARGRGQVLVVTMLTSLIFI